MTTVNGAMGITAEQHHKNMTGRIIDLKTELGENLLTRGYGIADTLKKIATADATIEEKLVAAFAFAANMARFQGALSGVYK